MSSRARAVVVAALVSVTLAACSSASGTPAPSAATPAPTASPSPSPVVAQLILQVTSEGGFIMPSANLNSVPAVSVYADGRILVPGPTPAIYPGPLVPPIIVRDLGPAGAAAIVAAIRAAGLDHEGPGGGIPGDTGVTIFTVNLDGKPVVTRFALGGGPGGPGGPGAPGGNGEDPALAAALDLLTKLSDPTETWGQPASQETPYLPTGYRIFVAPGAPIADASVRQVPMAWPLTPGLDAFGAPAVPDRGIPGLRLGVALGADAAVLAPVFNAATSVTPFTSDGQSYTLYVRPLLPDELTGAP